MKEQDVSDVEVQLLIEAIYRQHGYDFRNYSRAHMKRRILHRMGKEGLESISMMQHKVLHETGYFKSILPEFSINVTEMFRDSDFFRAIRDEVLPYIASFPKIKIWHAGCSSGEEVYSMAILLKEAGLYERCTIYGTDFNDEILKVAKDGIYPIESMKTYTKNYNESGGDIGFSEYYMAGYDFVMINQELKENISFFNHNLVTDSVFGEMDIIICRNVMIYFNRNLQNTVLKLFDESLKGNGILCLGTKETIEYSEVKKRYTTLDSNQKIFKKKLQYNKSRRLKSN